MIVSIHQPCFIPWPGFFEKVLKADTFVLLDTVQFEKNSFDNRNKVRIANGDTWLTIPVKTKGKFEHMTWQNLEIQNEEPWRKKHLKTLEHNYSKSRYWLKYQEKIREIYQKNQQLLLDFNLDFMSFIFNELEIETKIVRASDLDLTEKKSDLVLEILLKLGASTYISGAMGKNYLKESDFHRNNIEIIYQDYKPPIYAQAYRNFVPYMSILDVLLNHGRETRSIVLGETL